MKVTVTYLKFFGNKDSITTEELYFIDTIEADPLYLDFRFSHGESVRVRQAHLISLKIEKDPEVIIL